MAYSAEVIRRAREKLSQQKTDHESQYNRQLHDAYRQVPRLKEIDLQLRKTMTAAAQAAFLKGEDGVKAMEQIRDINLELQNERKALVEAHFAPGTLEEKPLCNNCGGSGYVGSTMCACLKELCRQEQMALLAGLTSGNERFENFRLDYYPEAVDPVYHVSPRRLMEKTLTVCRKYAAEFDGTGNLLFTGGTGLGKTFLSACIANVVADKGYSVAYESAPQLFEKLNKNFFNPDDQSRQYADSLQKADLLIIDDLGTELTNSFTVAALYSLVNERLLSGKSMIVSTNLNMPEIAQRYSPQIASRLEGCFKVATFVGQDIRVKRGV